jgi:hypothetical protein
MYTLYNRFNAKNFSGIFLFLFLLLSLPILVLSTLGARDSRSRAAVDSTAPTKPSSVRGMITMDGIKVFWNPSNDDVGVHSYRLLRNNTQIANVPGSVLEWPDVTAVSPYNYTYTVIAVDAAGNESAAGLMSLLRACSVLDTTDDEAIDLSDTLEILQYFGEAGPAFAKWDMNANGNIDLSDALENLQFFGEICTLFGASKPGPSVAAATAPAKKVNQQVTLRPGQTVKVGDLTLTWDYTVQPSSDPGTVAIIGRALVGTSSKYIGFAAGGAHRRLQDGAFGYTFSIKTATTKSVTITVKN